MAKLDIEEKFKKDISKEVANLKEFLISQGKEIHGVVGADNDQLREPEDSDPQVVDVCDGPELLS